MRVLVTGGSGMLGKVVIPVLAAAGHDVRLFSRAPRADKGVRASVTSAEDVREAIKGCEAIVHMAGRKNDEVDSWTVNVEGAKNIVAAAREHGVRNIINVSTQSAKLRRPGVYGLSKAEADRLFAESGLTVCTLRCSVLYGDSPTGIVGSILRFARLPLLPVIGSGRASYYPVHVQDVALMIARALEAPQPGVWDVGGTEEVSFNQLVTRVLQVVDHRCRCVHLPLWVCRLLALLPGMPITASNVRGASETVAMDPEPWICAIGLQPRTLVDGLRGLQVAAMQQEAKTLLAYISGEVVTDECLVERLLAAYAAHSLPLLPLLPLSARDRPRSLSTPDMLSLFCARSHPLRSKLLAAAAVWECQPGSAEVLLPKVRGCAALALQGMQLLLWWCGALIRATFCFPFWLSYLRRHDA